MHCFAVVVTKSHVPQALAVSRSLRAAGNLETLHVLLVDAERADLPASAPGLEFHGLDEFAGEFPPLMVHYYDAFELCNAMRPFFTSKLLREGAAGVVYLDSDIYAVGSFRPVWEALERHAIVQTPHVLQPADLDLIYIDEISIVDQGILNSGFSAWSNKPASIAALEWMKQRFPRYVFMRRSKGMYGDQKLMPFIANYFPDDVLVSRDPRLNIAFWNAQERSVVCKDGRYLIDGEPVVFFHMSGYRSQSPDRVCSYLSDAANGEMLRIAPWLGKVIRDYDAVLKECGLTGEPVRGEYKFARYAGFELNAPLRTILFKKGNLSWRDPEVWKIVLVERLRLIKRWIWSWFK